MQQLEHRGRSLQSWRSAARAVLQPRGRACGWGTGVSAFREGKEGEKGVTALVGRYLQGLWCCLSICPHFPGRALANQAALPETSPGELSCFGVTGDDTTSRYILLV